jgi:hypothetical protein
MRYLLLLAQPQQDVTFFLRRTLPSERPFAVSKKPLVDLLSAGESLRIHRWRHRFDDFARPLMPAIDVY